MVGAGRLSKTLYGLLQVSKTETYKVANCQNLRRPQAIFDGGAVCSHSAGTELGGCISEAEELQILLFRETHP